MNAEAAYNIQNLLSFVSAVLGGFSIALAVGLLQLEAKNKVILWATTLAILSAVVLIFATVTGTFGAVWIAERPALSNEILNETPQAVLTAFRWSGGSFLIGILLLLLSMGISGFIRSKSMGIITSLSTLVISTLLLYFLVVVVDVL